MAFLNIIWNIEASAGNKCQIGLVSQLTRFLEFLFLLNVMALLLKTMELGTIEVMKTLCRINTVKTKSHTFLNNCVFKYLILAADKQARFK